MLLVETSRGLRRFLGLSGLALFVFFAKYHRTVDPEWYWPLTQEGYLNSYAIFLVRRLFPLLRAALDQHRNQPTPLHQVTWIIAYNAVHF